MIKCKIRILMAEKNINIVELADEIKVSRHTISRLYNETAPTYSDKILNKLCSFFNCDVGDLLKYEVDKEKAA